VFKTNSNKFVFNPLFISLNKNNWNIFPCIGLKTSAVVNSNSESRKRLIRKLRVRVFNNNERLEKLLLVKFNQGFGADNLADLGMSSEYGYSFSWFLDEKGKLIDFNRKMNLLLRSKWVKLASEFLEKWLKVEKSDISEVKIMDVLKPLAERFYVTVLDIYSPLSEIFGRYKDISPEGLASISSESLKREAVGGEVMKRPPIALGSLEDTNINELYLKLNNMEYPLKNVDVSLNLFKVVPTLWWYRVIEITYTNSAYHLSESKKMSPSKLDRWLLHRPLSLRLRDKGKGRATRMWSAFFVLIATVTIIIFLQKGFLSGNFFNYEPAEGGETINQVYPLSYPTFEGLVEEGIGSSVKNAFILLFLSNKLNSLSLKLKKMSMRQLIKFIFKALSSLLLFLLFIYYNVNPSVILSYLITITLYDLAKIWLVGNVGALLYFISSLIIYIHYCKILDKSSGKRRVVKVRISPYWPTFVFNLLNDLLLLSKSPNDFRQKWINQYWLNIFYYCLSVSLLLYYLIA